MIRISKHWENQKNPGKRILWQMIRARVTMEKKEKFIMPITVGKS